MRYSFVVPIHKKSLETLKDCLNSLVEQTYEDIEVICSFDGADPVLESYVDSLVEKDKRVKKVVGEHGGACKARNAGFKAITGDVVSFWDSDCYAAPGMVYVWDLFFKEDSELDFVYSDYAFTNQEIPGREAPPRIDRWLMTKYNDLCSMWPIRKEKVVKWDETLGGMQDWAFWREIVSNGAKGKYNKGFAFTTEFPDPTSISGQYSKNAERVKAIRAKFNDPELDVLVYGNAYSEMAKRIAKYVDGDFFYMWPDLYKTHDYKLEIACGFHGSDIPLLGGLFADTPSKKVIYWMGMDAEEFYSGPFNIVSEIVPKMKEKIHFHFCVDKTSQDTLKKLGIEAEIVIPPRDRGEFNVPLPEKFKVFCYHDEGYEQLIDSIIKAMPDIEFDKLKTGVHYNLSNYSLILQFTADQRLQDGTRNAIMLGRQVISNVKEPYAGYEDITQEVSAFKKSVIERIRAFQVDNSPNLKAREYYAGLTDPDGFKGKIKLIMAPVMEVI